MSQSRDTSSSTELINCYNSNTIQAQELRLLCLSGSLQSSSNVKSGVSSWWILQDIKEIVKERLSKLSKEATYHSFTPILKVSQPYLVSFSILDLYEVTLSSPCSQSSALPLHWRSPESLRFLPCSLSSAYPLLSCLHESSFDECLHIK